MKIQGSFHLAGFELFEAKGFFIGQVILWGKGNRSLFAIWKEERFTVDLLWMRVVE